MAGKPNSRSKALLSNTVLNAGTSLGPQSSTEYIYQPYHTIGLPPNPLKYNTSKYVDVSSAANSSIYLDIKTFGNVTAPLRFMAGEKYTIGADAAWTFNPTNVSDPSKTLRMLALYFFYLLVCMLA